ncbi:MULTISPECIES: DNA adenine methylase [unclassified Marinimicrobium]|jgi:DNA adenine methylase|uniref:DNA adenine methylase n=1 Tax=unclassified Marinimicrobium TaxID=2632100 RepID=UPI000C3EF780|nr:MULTISPECIES: DNA adenine methylase [unclassified Marinimicrobium]MAN51226.1 restriction endonuclease subunit M [Marinimicrobium sp.]|tara:strand:+ start:850 stop:1641 length:792 start_codon:yes stop_codon:yes gene_type:complete
MATPIIPWLGGKRRLVDRILPLLPQHSCYVEPFAGGAALFFLRPVPAEVEVLNDINGDLVNLYRVVQNHLEEFVRQFKWALSSRQVFKWQQMTRPETLTDIQRAARFYYLQQSAFGGRVDGQSYGTATTTPPGLNLLRLEESLSAAHLRLASTYIEHLAWQDCIRRYDRPHTLFYMDPPYWETEGYGVDFGWEHYQAMAELLHQIKGKAVISLNDHPDIRELFKDFHIESTDIKYTVGGGKGSDAREVLIFSWDVQSEPAGLF